MPEAARGRLRWAAGCRRDLALVPGGGAGRCGCEGCGICMRHAPFEHGAAQPGGRESESGRMAAGESLACGVFGQRGRGAGGMCGAARIRVGPAACAASAPGGSARWDEKTSAGVRGRAVQEGALTRRCGCLRVASVSLEGRHRAVSGRGRVRVSAWLGRAPARLNCRRDVECLPLGEGRRVTMLSRCSGSGACREAVIFHFTSLHAVVYGFTVHTQPTLP